MRGPFSKSRLVVLAFILLAAPTHATEQPSDASGRHDKAKKTSVPRAKAPPAGAHREPDAPLAPWAAVDPGRIAKPSDEPSPAPRAASSRFDIDPDKIDYGMKANGANVSPGQTRNQNYNGNVTGIGGELGMKVPF